MPICGIYTIINLLDGKIYVGYTNNFNKRVTKHITSLKNNSHVNIHLQSAWNKYGKEAFKFEILEECEKQFLASQEHYWATMLNVHDDEYGYNMKPTHPEKKNLCTKEMVIKAQATRLKNARNRGYWFTEETLTKLRGPKWTEEQKIEIGNKGRGLKRSKETKEKISKAKLGVPRPANSVKKAVLTKQNNKKKLNPEWLPKAERPKIREHSKGVVLFLENGKIIEFKTIRACADFLGKSHKYVTMRLYNKTKKQKTMKVKIKFKKIRKKSEELVYA